MKKQFTKNSIALILGMVVALTFSYANAMSRPTVTTSSYPEIFNEGTKTQIKNGQLTLKSFIAGDYGTNNSTNVFAINSLGAIAIGKKIDANTFTSGIALDVTGTTSIKGSIRSSVLAKGATRPLCVNSDGKIDTCNVVEFTTSTTNVTKYAALQIPYGVTSMNVEVYGGGGAGYGDKNGAFSNGDSSYIKGNTVSLFANGGGGAMYVGVPGKGGTSTPTSASGSVSNITNITGGDGGTPGSSNTGYTPTQLGSTYFCNTGGNNFTMYYLMKGGVGGDGTYGGKSGNGNNTTIASGNSGGPTSYVYGNGTVLFDFTSNPCGTYDDTNADDWLPSSLKNLRPGNNGVNGTLGQGGGGFGGKGGVSAFTQDTSCSSVSTNSSSCYGDVGAAGGGGGGYIKADVSVSGGQTFYIKVGGGGTTAYTSCNQNNQNTCNNLYGGGAISGNGGDGYIKITYN